MMLVAGCAADERLSVGDASTTTGPSATTSSTPTSTLPTTTAPDTSTTTAPGTTTVAESADPPPCEVDGTTTGPLLEYGVLFQGAGTPPPGWAPSQPSFDWDQDGEADDLVLADDKVSVQWSDGALTVSGVRADFSHMPQTQVIPAEVADVTGDGRPDLIVAQDGEVAVVAGAGADSVALDAAFEDVGESVNGWRNPPVELEVPGEDPVLEPIASATVITLWDVTGDGITDFSASSVIRRANGRFFVYAGKPCV